MFEYTCQECGQGTVKEKRIKRYKTKIKGYPFTIPEAVVGICDRCKAEHFAAEETKRWEELFSQSLEKEKLFLLPKDIERVRKALELSMENFALLIGSTRQSLYNWENGKRPRPQSRIADLLIKLVDKSRSEKEVNVLDFLVREARKLGVVIELPVEVKATESAKSLILKVKQTVEQLVAPRPIEKLALAAEQETGRKISVVETEDGKRLGILKYNYENATLILEVEQEDLDVSPYSFELVMNDGQIIKPESPEVKDGHAVLLRDSKYTPKDIEEIRLTPRAISVWGYLMDSKEQRSRIKKLESRLRELKELQLMSAKVDKSSDIYNEICELVFDEDFYKYIWDEPVLLQLHHLFAEKPPEIRVFGERANYLEERTESVRIVNDLYFSILDNSANEEEVVKKLAKILDIDEHIPSQLQADNRLNNIRSGDTAPSEKNEAFLSHFSEDLTVDFGEWGECMKQCLFALQQREEIGRANAVLVNSQANRAIVSPIKILVQSGDGRLKHLVSGRENFKSAIERAMQCLIGDGFIKPNDDVLYTLDLTEAEYSGDSIALPAAIAMFSAAKGIKIDAYTAFSGNINFFDRQWVIKSVTGIPQKLQAALAYGCRRVFLPKENEADVQPGDAVGLEVIFVSNLMEVLLKLQTLPERLQGDSLHVRKINKLRAVCQGEGWQLSDPFPVQAGLQFVVTPPTPPELKLNIYGTGAHSPRRHESNQFQALLLELAKLEESGVPIQSVQQVFQIRDSGLRAQIRQELDKMKPSGSREEQHCEYSYSLEDGKQKLIIKQFNSGKLQLQGMAGDLYKRALDVIVTLYNLKYPQAKLMISDYLRTRPQEASGKSYSESGIEEVPLPYIGTDESGKGDYFGPMVIAGVWVDAPTVRKLESIGVKDSKMLSDKRCRTLAGEIRRICKGKYQEVEISPERYNELYEQFRAEKKNLNHLLAWGHARALESILERLACTHAVADQFGDEQYIRSKLMQRGKDLKLIQVPKGERYLAVAAASILARDYFLRRLDQISQQVGIALPKGASDAVIAAAKTIVKQASAEELRKVAKLHFKTTILVIDAK